jgi:hypothetical protein
MNDGHYDESNGGIWAIGILIAVCLAAFLCSYVLHIAQVDPSNPPPAVERHRGE